MSKRKPKTEPAYEPPAPEPMNTIAGVQAEYNRQYERYAAARKAWYDANPYVRGENRVYPGLTIDYDGMGGLLVKAIQAEYGFSEARAGAVYGLAYEKGHSSFSDVFCYAYEFADFVKGLPA
jgi:hypothetical protein